MRKKGSPSKLEALQFLAGKLLLENQTAQETAKAV